MIILLEVTQEDLFVLGTSHFMPWGCKALHKLAHSFKPNKNLLGFVNGNDKAFVLTLFWVKFWNVTEIP